MNLRVLSKLCAASTSLMKKLKFSAKISLLGISVLALSGSIIGFLLNNLQTQADFSIQESYGVEYLNPLKNLLLDLQKYRDSKTPENAANIQSDIQNVDTIDKKYNKKLSIDNKWTDLKETIAKNAVNEAISQELSFNDHITNKSNLMLDPDIDTYYLMDSFCVRFPNSMEKIYNLKTLGGNKIQNKPFSQYELIKLVTLLDELNEIQKTNISMITNYNPDTKNALDEAFKNAYNSNHDFINLTNNLINGSKISLSEYNSKANKAVANNKKADEIYSTELYKLIEKRIHKYADQKPVYTLITVIALLFVGYLFIGFYMSLVESVSQVAEELTDISDNVKNNTIEMSSDCDELAKDNKQLASSTQETASTMEEMTSMVEQNKENSKMAKQLTFEAKGAADEGTKDMSEMMTSMSELKDSSSEIAKIIKIIDEIAFQTNILALNAAVEAARAGDAGKGFAVVAEEVRNLAQRTVSAASDTTSIIEKNITLSENGLKIAQKTNNTLGEMNDKIQKVSQIINEVAIATDEQAQGIGQINKSISLMNSATHNNAKVASGNVNMIQNLSDDVEQMKQTVIELAELISCNG